MSALQLKAVLIITMLAGHEAKRINDAAAAMAAMGQSVRVTPEEAYQELNDKCDRSWSGHCSGEGCESRRLTLDWPPPSSQSCRRTDDWMMKKENGGVQNFKTLVAFLEAKSIKYA